MAFAPPAEFTIKNSFVYVVICTLGVSNDDAINQDRLDVIYIHLPWVTGRVERMDGWLCVGCNEIFILGK